MKTKIFTGSTTDAIEREINAWMESEREKPSSCGCFKVLNVLQSESVEQGDYGYNGEWNLTITIFYQEAA